MNIINTRSILILTAILVFGVLVTMVLVSQSTSDTKTDSSEAAEGATGLGAKRIRPARDTQSKPPTVNVKKRDSQPAAGEEVESSEIREIRQALSELLALEEGVGSNQQIQEKKAALKAAVERGMEKDPKSVLKLLLGLVEISDEGVTMIYTDVSRSFIQRAPELAIALLDQVPNVNGLSVLANNIGSAWAESDPKAALAWANQQTDPEFKEWTLTGVIPIMAKTDLQGAFAYAQSLPPGDFQDYMIRSAFSSAAIRETLDDDKLQGALAMMQSLPEGRIRDLAASGISQGMAAIDPQAIIIESIAENDPKAAMDMATGIGDTSIRFESEQSVAGEWFYHDPAAATQWMQSLPEGKIKDLASSNISQRLAEKDPQAAMDMASGIGDTGIRTEAQKTTAEIWLTKDPAAATQWINRSTLPQEVKNQLLLPR